MHFTPLIGGWVVRWFLELFGWASFAVTTYTTIYNALPAGTQAQIDQAWQGNWQGLTVGTLVAVIPVVWARVWSFRSTTSAQIVADSDRVLTRSDADVVLDETRERVTVRDLKEQAPRRRTVVDRVTEALGSAR